VGIIKIIIFLIVIIVIVIVIIIGRVDFRDFHNYPAQKSFKSLSLIHIVCEEKKIEVLSNQAQIAAAKKFSGE